MIEATASAAQPHLMRKAGSTRSKMPFAPAESRAGGQHPIAYALLILLNATLFIRPGEIIPATQNWPIYLWLIIGCAAAALPVLVRQLHWNYLSRNSAILCVVLLIAAVFLSHARHGDLWSARYDAVDFAKIVLFFLLVAGLVDSIERLGGFLALTVVFIAITAVLAILNYHEIFSLTAMTVLERGEGFNEETGERETFDQLQATGIFSDPNDFAVILVTAILGAVHLTMESKSWGKKAAWIAILPILMYAFAMTKSRGGFLSLTAGAAAFLYARYGLKKAMKLGIFLLPVLLAGFAGRQTNISVTDTSDTAYGRVLLWRDGLMLFKQSPGFGIGFGLYGEEVGQVAHNSYVHAFTELGFFGGCLFLAAFLVPIFSCRKIAFNPPTAEAKRMSATIFALVIAYAVGIFSLSRNSSNATYLVLGIACAFCALGQSEKAPWMKFDWRLIKRTSIAGIALLVFVSVLIRVLT